MKVAWVFPVQQKCGISFYSHAYINALAQLITIEAFDVHACAINTTKTCAVLNTFDIIHIQYETSFFSKKNQFEKLCNRVKKPLIITLHEVYEEFPGVFPRSQIAGTGIVRKSKEYLYDLRHPFQTMYARHLSHRFHAKKIAVHAQYQKALLIKNGIPEKMVSVIPVPVTPIDLGTQSPAGTGLHLSSTGFINSNYDYQLLFEVLENLRREWKFTWIGGLRRDEDIPLLNHIRKEIAQRKWEHTFIITGWVPDDFRDSLLSQTDIYLALFSARSSSLSLATALGARRLIVATDIPGTNELALNHHIMSLAAPNSADVINTINRLVSDTALKESRLREIDTYCRNHSFNQMARQLVDVYKECIA